ncbi:MAG: hypothetical protein IIW69_03500, partial [Bacteroidaceae bacterium]|nr:hypothetical protein [Bacteroidaceae bacterium]
FSHMDVGVNVGTTGLGIDVGVNVGNYVRLRAGYNYMPRISMNTDFTVETSKGGIGNLIDKIDRIEEKFEEHGIDMNSESFAEYKALFDKFSKVERKDYVTMALKPNLHQFKFMVDVMPFKNNKHWSFTAGFFVGPSTVGYAENLEKEVLMLEGVNAYNKIYMNYPEHGINGTWLQDWSKGPDKEPWKDDPFYKHGLAGFCLGRFADGDMALMVPGEDASAKAEMVVSKVRPYVGFGYQTDLSRDRKWKLNVDAGVMFLCGSPSVYVDNVYKFDAGEIRFDEDGRYLSGMGFDIDGNYYGEIVRWFEEDLEYKYVGQRLDHVDVVHDLHDTPGKVGRTINTISKFKVYPNISVGISYRLF